MKEMSSLKQEGHDGPGSLTWVIFPTLVPTCDHQGGSSFDPQGDHVNKIDKGYKEMLHTENLSSISSSFSEEEFWSWSSLFLCSNLWPQEWDQFWPQIIWIKLIKVHKEMLNTKYQSSNPSSFREEEFWSWFSLFLCSNLWPPGWGQSWP